MQALGDTGGAPRLAVQGLAVGHGDRAVVADVDLALRPGRCTVLVGANGSGKSTLLRTMAGLLAPHAGTVRVDGRPLGALRPRAAARHVGFLPQAPLVPAGLTVRELVAYGRHPHRRLLGGPSTEDEAAVAWAVEVTGLDDLAERPVAQLSGGERQRAWLGVDLAQRTPVLLLDEPTTFLDVRHQLEVLGLVRRLVDEHGLAVAVVLHDLDQAAWLADELVVLGGGRVVAQGPPAAVLTAGVVRAAFAVDAEVTADPVTGAPTCRFRVPVPARS